MAKLYADEHFPFPVVELLRQKGHDVLTVQEAGKAGLKIPDNEVLAFATSQNRAVLTLNRYDFKQLHQSLPDHAGIINCSNDRDWEGFAGRINRAILEAEPLMGKLVRVVKPAK